MSCHLRRRIAPNALVSRCAFADDGGQGASRNGSLASVTDEMQGADVCRAQLANPTSLAPAQAPRNSARPVDDLIPSRAGNTQIRLARWVPSRACWLSWRSVSVPSGRFCQHSHRALVLAIQDLPLLSTPALPGPTQSPTRDSLVLRRLPLPCSPAVEAIWAIHLQLRSPHPISTNFARFDDSLISLQAHCGFASRVRFRTPARRDCDALLSG